ncbi:hypothetical protein ACQP25_33835 [Microtetraspora malaysiensis]|uniref:hypothetical protein n=1 Tax=Microtetraspora malaysiensis TaxID=161358 RepID=UPI003D92CFEC
MPLALLASAVTGFGVGTSEFAIMGLLPQVAAGVEVSIPAAGVLISGYAAGVILAAPLNAVGAGPAAAGLALAICSGAIDARAKEAVI